MQHFIVILSCPKTILRLGGGLVLLSLILALISQYGFGLHPCELCIWQRYPASFAVGLWLLAELTSRWRGMPFLFAVACLTTAAIALYHTGIEQTWWQGPAECSGDTIDSDSLSIEELKQHIMNAPMVRCDEPALEVMGLTMASTNFLFSLGLAIMAMMSLMMSKGKKDEKINEDLSSR